MVLTICIRGVMSKSRFFMYTEYINFLDGMEVSDQALLFRVILQYEGGLEVEEMTPAVRAVFALIKSRLDNNRDEYERVCEVNRENGKKGGRPKKTEENRNKPNETENNPDNDNDKDKENDKDIASPPYPPSIRRVIEKWNGLADVGVRQITSVNGNRRVLLDARLKEHGLQAVEDAIERIRGSTFLRGGGSKGWVITFDWFIKPNNFPKVAEGNYDDAKGGGKDAETGGWQSVDDFYRQWEGNDGDSHSGGAIRDGT